MNWEKFGIDIQNVRGGKGYCPKCHDERKNKRDRSLSVNKENGLFNCHHCEFKGTAMEYFKPERQRKIYRKPTPRPAPPQSKVVQWFAGRGISEATLERAKITESVEYMPQVNGQANCICFPYYRDGELVNIKYRDGAKNFKLEKDAELIFFGLDSVKEYREQAIITEGEIDALSVMEIGIKAAILSVPNGASKGNQRLEYLDNCWEALESFTDIIIATDCDAAGIALRDELGRRLGPDRCFFLEYPEGTKDINEVLLRDGALAVADLLQNAKPFPLFGVETANDQYYETLAIMQNGYPEGLRSGWEELDKLIRFDSCGLTTITGIPGSGKSTWLNNLLVRMANRNNWRIGMFTPEMQPSKVLFAQLTELMVGKGLRSGMSIDEFSAAMHFLSDHFWIMKIDEIDLTIDGILEKAVELVKFYGINALVIDPYNYVEATVAKGQNESSYVSNVLSKIKRFKDRYNVHVFLIAHPVKMEKTDANVFKVPNLYSISGSAHFYNKTDNGIVVYRNTQTGVIEIHVQKVRWWYLGETGIANMYYDKHTRLFTDYPKQVS